MLHLNRRYISNSLKARSTFSESLAYMQVIIIISGKIMAVNFPVRRQKLSRKIAPGEGEGFSPGALICLVTLGRDIEQICIGYGLP